MQSGDDEAVAVEAEGAGSNTKASDVAKTRQSRMKIPRSLRARFLSLEKLASLFFTTFGAVLTLGLILNLNGYGYRFSLSEGMRIDTLDEMRFERQLENGSAPKAVPQNSRPTDSLIEFFNRHPFTASLILTGVAVAYEEVVKVPLARRKQK